MQAQYAVLDVIVGVVSSKSAAEWMKKQFCLLQTRAFDLAPTFEFLVHSRYKFSTSESPGLTT